jgi:hypothetical protein
MTLRQAFERLFPHWRNPAPRDPAPDEPRTAEQWLRDVAESGR